MFNSILIVCTGNICRSPIGERLFHYYLDSKKIDSAGVGALVGHAADEMASKVAKMHGLSLDGHYGKQFDSDLARQYDLILVMEKHHIEKVSSISPEARGKTFLLGHWLNKQEIPDPYKQSQEAFEYVYDLINQSCLSWVKKIDV
ncbi:protein tyrosine phosphatase [Klebsiella quasipneumoniae]|uniref:arsenate reductase/protein-tyrosine-phosphatase family protein n=1 Tax=Klebsiella quasipneumoniae TaxID=1463165 RepID=UPI00265C42F8|nr:protein tyrosine phosphatase [Klebsiella quasipneumoniae]MDO0740258.1 protein tyrosine phosphatase [Klebsiella quasipneumoniae]HEN5330527.1 protein tyrosine phosphatase [Klebsiella quasipneumoniae]